MGNRIVGNVIIIDSAMGNVSILGPESGNTINRLFQISSVAFWSTDTLGVFRISGANTSNILLTLQNPNKTDAATVGITLNDVTIENIKVPTLTAGTAWIYLT